MVIADIEAGRKCCSVRSLKALAVGGEGGRSVADRDPPFACWRKIKARFSRAVGGRYARSASKAAKGELGLWQRRYWEHMIRDGDDYRRHVEYCRINPVKHGLVVRVRDWPHSSFHRDVRRGVVPVDWAGEMGGGEFGE